MLTHRYIKRPALSRGKEIINLFELTFAMITFYGPFFSTQKIFFICDVPHLIKTARNNLENSHENLKNTILVSIMCCSTLIFVG